MGNRKIIPIGTRFGRWITVSIQQDRHIVCECECGERRNIFIGNLQTSKSKSCGCLRIDVNRELHKKHGKKGSRTYNIWNIMIQRCSNKNSSSYLTHGARGIKVCDKWKYFCGFYNDMGDPPRGASIDRIDNNGDYCKDNCRWATNYEQANNRRDNKFITYEGVTLTIAQWAREKNIRPRTLYNRVMNDWPIDKLFIPADRGRKVK